MFKCFRLSVILSVLALVFFCGCATQSSDSFAKQMKEYLSKDEHLEEIDTALEKYYAKKFEDEADDVAAEDGLEIEDEPTAAVEKKGGPTVAPTKLGANEIGTSPVAGPGNAKVTIFEFSDFQCPYCKRGSDVMAEVKKKYPKNVRIVFKNLPLDFHEHAVPAARAALAAKEQGKFWEMAESLFDNQSELGESLYVELAKKHGLNVEKFKSDMKSAKVSDQIKADVKLAGSLNIQGTPAFIVNGVRIAGAQPLEVFSEQIDKQLK